MDGRGNIYINGADFDFAGGEAPAEWRKADDITSNLERLANGPRTGEILTLPVSVPGTGRP